MNTRSSLLSLAAAFAVLVSTPSLAGEDIATTTASTADSTTGVAGAQPGGPNLSETVGDWVVRCFPVKAPAPCEVLQITAAKDNQDQRVFSVSFAYVPSRDSYGMQIVVPLGVSVPKGLSVGKETGVMSAIKYDRCQEDGCYAEDLIPASAVDSLAMAGESVLINVTAYGQAEGTGMVLSLKGFGDSIARLKTLARERAVGDIPAGTATDLAPN